MKMHKKRPVPFCVCCGKNRIFIGAVLICDSCIPSKKMKSKFYISMMYCKHGAK